MKYLFIFSQQDDEFGVFWEISKLTNNDQEVSVVYLTSGNRKGDENKIRNAESVKVLGTLGVSKSNICLLYTSPSPRDKRQSRMPSSA